MEYLGLFVAVAFELGSLFLMVKLLPKKGDIQHCISITNTDKDSDKDKEDFIDKDISKEGIAESPLFDSLYAHQLLMQRSILHEMNATNADAGETIAFHEGWIKRINKYISAHSDGNSANTGGGKKKLH